jgi:hypothetical protein
VSSSSVGRLADELGSLLLPLIMPVVRRLPGVVVGCAVLATLLCVFALVGTGLDEAAIHANRGTAVAEVLDGSGPGQTLVRFSTADGRVVIPERGAFYPGGLVPGDTVLVEYDLREPERVQIAGRDASGGVLPITLGAVAVWLVALPLAVWLRRQPFTISGERARAAKARTAPG